MSISPIYQEKFEFDVKPEMQLILLYIGSILLTFIVQNTWEIFGHNHYTIYGWKTIGIFDIWSIEHIFSGMCYAYFTISMRDKFKHPLMLLLLYAYLWEVIEHYLETVAPDAVLTWFGGVECLSNRLLADPLCTVIGFLLVKQFPKMLWPARIFSCSFLAFHIFIVQNSMYFHT